MIEINKIHQGDCLELMKEIDDNSVDMILCDLPYGTTACSWDTIIPFDKLWRQYKRIIKDNCAIVLTASQPFTSIMINSNMAWFREELIWEKHRASNFVKSRTRHMKYHESVIIFSLLKTYKYNPQMIKRESPRVKQHQESGWKGRNSNSKVSKNSNNQMEINYDKYSADFKLPSSVIKIPSVVNNSKEYLNHPTQKPIALFEYLIKTYTNEGDLVLDNCIGSGTTAVACKQTGRRFIGIEKEQKYVDIANKRLEQQNLQLSKEKRMEEIK